MQIARFFDKLSDDKVQCHLCAHECTIDAGKRGVCAVRENRGGTLYSLVYGRVISENVDPIEKKPLFHFLPGSRVYSIATVGCNLQCQHCQNYDISQYPKRHDNQIIGERRTPAQIIEQVLATQSVTIAYTYTEPTIFLEFALDIAELARAKGLHNVFVSNGFMTEASAKAAAAVLDAANIDLKSFSDRFYTKVCKARLQPVLDTIQRMKAAGVWVEVTTLLIPGLNDSDAELRDIAQFLYATGPEIPWHVTAFYPTYKLTDRPPTPVQSLRRAREIGLTEGLRYVYTGNIPGDAGENTYCPACNQLMIERRGFNIVQNRVQAGLCSECGGAVDGVWQ